MGILADTLVKNGGYNPTDAANAENGPRAAELAKEFNVGGVGGVAPVSKPTVDLQGVYDSALKAGGVDQSQAQADQIGSQIDAKRQAASDAAATINDNPWYAEASRTGRLAKLDQQTQSDIGNLTNQQSIAQGKVAAVKADAQVKLNIASQQYNIQSQEYQQSLQQANSLLTSGALDNASPSDIASIATSTGLSPSMVQSIIDTSKAKNAVKPQLVTIDDGKNQIIKAVDQNGNVINSQVLGASVKAQTTGTKAEKPVEPAKYLTPATKILGEMDIAATGKGTADKLLSRGEQQQAFNQILALVGGDQSLAQQVFQQAFDVGGYGNYGN